MKTEKEIKTKKNSLSKERKELREYIESYSFGWFLADESVRRRYDELNLRISMLDWVLKNEEVE